MTTLALIIGYAVICIVTILFILISGALIIDRLTFAYAFTRGTLNIKYKEPKRKWYAYFWYAFWHQQPSYSTTITSKHGYRVCGWNSCTHWHYSEKRE